MESVVVSTPDMQLSGWHCRVDKSAARGLIVALHGGGYNSQYWNYASPGKPTLAELAAALGFHLLALDRPGYGTSRSFEPARLTIAEQAVFIFDSIDAWCAMHEFDGPVFLIGHSLGGILSLVMAAHPRGSRLTAVDVLGVPYRYATGLGGTTVQALAATAEHVPPISRDTSLLLMFGPEGTYDSDALQHPASQSHPMPAAEYRDGIGATALWPELLPAIRIPVQFTVAEHETMQETGWPVLDAVQRLLNHSPHVVTHFLKASGHSASLHRIGAAYHLRAMAFFEECIALRAAG